MKRIVDSSKNLQEWKKCLEDYQKFNTVVSKQAKIYLDTTVKVCLKGFKGELN